MYPSYFAANLLHLFFPGPQDAFRFSRRLPASKEAPEKKKKLFWGGFNLCCRKTLVTSSIWGCNWCNHELNLIWNPATAAIAAITATAIQPYRRILFQTVRFSDGNIILSCLTNNPIDTLFGGLVKIPSSRKYVSRKNTE